MMIAPAEATRILGEVIGVARRYIAIDEQPGFLEELRGVAGLTAR